jgi:nicotinamidase/pyrazinamidase
MRNKKALIVVDAQNDFMPGGSLAVKDGVQIIPKINNLLSEFELVIFTKDWHAPDMNAFASSHKNTHPFDTYIIDDIEDTYWPDHCVANTPGADLHKDIDFGKIDGDFYIFKKGINKDEHPYSGFGADGLKEFLEEKEVTDLFICGLATDYCVKETAIDSANLGFKTYMILDATKPIAEDITDTMEDLYNTGVNIINTWQLPLIKIL